MVEVCREVKRVLRPDGTFWLNVGDSYASTGGEPDRLLRDHVRPFGNVKGKDLIGIPWMVAFALRGDGWYLRSEVIWGKTAPMPESVIDRPTGAHERIFLLTKSPKYHFDGYATEDPAVSPHGSGNGFIRPQRIKFEGRGNTEPWNGVGLTRNIRSVWMLGPERAPDFHFATFVSEVPRRCILSSLGLKGVCAKCGAPWKRITKAEILDADKSRRPLTKTARHDQATNSVGSDTWGHQIIHKTLGWQPTCDCNCPDTIPGLVLDPFLGSGTTALVANQLGHDAIGIELNPENAEGARRRIEIGNEDTFFRRKVYMEYEISKTVSIG